MILPGCFFICQFISTLKFHYESVKFTTVWEIKARGMLSIILCRFQFIACDPFFFQSLENVQYYIHVFALFSIGFEEEILQYGGGHERKDPSILQGSSTQLHRNWSGINLWFIIKCLYFINQSCIWYLVISVI